jgi:hypothetical protein
MRPRDALNITEQGMLLVARAIEDGGKSRHKDVGMEGSIG